MGPAEAWPDAGSLEADWLMAERRAAEAAASSSSSSNARQPPSGLPSSATGLAAGAAEAPAQPRGPVRPAAPGSAPEHTAPVAPSSSNPESTAAGVVSSGRIRRDRLHDGGAQPTSVAGDESATGDAAASPAKGRSRMVRRPRAPVRPLGGSAAAAGGEGGTLPLHAAVPGADSRSAPPSGTPSGPAAEAGPSDAAELQPAQGGAEHELPVGNPWLAMHALATLGRPPTPDELKELTRALNQAGAVEAAAGGAAGPSGRDGKDTRAAGSAAHVSDAQLKRLLAGGRLQPSAGWRRPGVLPWAPRQRRTRLGGGVMPRERRLRVPATVLRLARDLNAAAQQGTASGGQKAQRSRAASPPGQQRSLGSVRRLVDAAGAAQKRVERPRAARGSLLRPSAIPVQPAELSLNLVKAPLEAAQAWAAAGATEREQAEAVLAFLRSGTRVGAVCARDSVVVLPRKLLPAVVGAWQACELPLTAQ